MCSGAEAVDVDRQDEPAALEARQIAHRAAQRHEDLVGRQRVGPVITRTGQHHARGE